MIKPLTQTYSFIVYDKDIEQECVCYVEATGVQNAQSRIRDSDLTPIRLLQTMEDFESIFGLSKRMHIIPWN